MEDKIIYCKLTEKSSRKVWVIEPKQFYPDKTEIYPLSVSLASTVIDRIEHPIGCVIGLYSSKLTLASTKNIIRILEKNVQKSMTIQYQDLDIKDT